MIFLMFIICSCIFVFVVKMNPANFPYYFHTYYDEYLNKIEKNISYQKIAQEIL